MAQRQRKNYLFILVLITLAIFNDTETEETFYLFILVPITLSISTAQRQRKNYLFILVLIMAQRQRKGQNESCPDLIEFDFCMTRAYVDHLLCIALSAAMVCSQGR